MNLWDIYNQPDVAEFVDGAVETIMDIIRTFGAVGIIPPGNPLASLGHVARGLVRSWKR